jgi:hypothetical protein
VFASEGSAHCQITPDLSWSSRIFKKVEILLIETLKYNLSSSYQQKPAQKTGSSCAISYIGKALRPGPRQLIVVITFPSWRKSERGKPYMLIIELASAVDTTSPQERGHKE